VPSDIFKVLAIGNKYSRSDIYKLLNIPTQLQGGDWNTGYHKYNGVWFIFSTISEGGRTGHNYANVFRINKFIWSGKVGSRIDHPSIQDLINPATETLLFTRETNREAFVYRGRLAAIRIEDQIPVEVTWSFNDLGHLSNENDVLPNAYHEDKMINTNPTISKLLEQSIGGEDAICLPGQSDSQSFMSDSPAGVREAIDDFYKEINNQDSNKVEYLFLVGGAGNGKSFELSLFLKKLGSQYHNIVRGAKLKRHFLKDDGDPNVYIINDATIVEQANGERHDLIYDLKYCSSAKTRTFLFANINRGVLIEDINHAADADMEWKDILTWLLNPRTHKTEAIETIDASERYFLRGKLRNGVNEVPTFINVLYLDQLSLLEKIPGYPEKSLEDTTSLTPKVSKYQLFRPEESRQETPLGRLLKLIVDKNNFEDHESCLKCGAKSLCPFISNVQNLRNSDFQIGYLYFLRSIECGSGQLFSYREAWYNLSISIIGRVRQIWLDEEANQSPCDWVRANAIGSPSKKQLYDLFLHRIHSSLFNSEQLNVNVEYAPLLYPNDLNPSDQNVLVQRNSLSDPSKGTNRKWQSQIYEAVESTHYRERPSENMDVAINFADLWKNIDREIESDIVKQFQNNLEEYSSLLRWFTSALIRLLGFRLRNVNNGDIIDQFLELKRYPKFDDSNPLSRGIKNLLRRTGDSDKNYYPIFTPRTKPVLAHQETPQWCVGVPHYYYSVELETDADDLWLKLFTVEKKTIISNVLIDFPMAIEIFNNSDGQGFSEKGHQVSPRLERAWSQIMHSALGDQEIYVVQSSPSLIKFTVE
jgi:hypothetical protein